jgi:3-hydroxyisobutyrate dehydrogenase-like beta-hydroxyacid dehydrogenase
MSGPMTSAIALALIGYGEVGQIFAQEFRAQGVNDIAVYDIVFDLAPTGRERVKRAREAQVRPASSAADAARGADIVISAVTADAAAAVAMQAAKYLRPGQIFFDINSASPATKRASAQYVEAASAHFVEGAVMAPVPGRGIRVPILAGGPHAETAAQMLNAMGMNIRPVSTQPGRASATKLCRSIMIKGIEALIIDCAVAASKWASNPRCLPAWLRLFRRPTSACSLRPWPYAFASTGFDAQPRCAKPPACSKISGSTARWPAPSPTPKSGPRARNHGQTTVGPWTLRSSPNIAHERERVPCLPGPPWQADLSRAAGLRQHAG